MVEASGFRAKDSVLGSLGSKVHLQILRANTYLYLCTLYILALNLPIAVMYTRCEATHLVFPCLKYLSVYVPPGRKCQGRAGVLVILHNSFLALLGNLHQKSPNPKP